MYAKQLLAALFVAGVRAEAAAQCTSDLQIDNFANFASLSNSLNQPASDDQSMASIAASGGILQFTPRDANSYFYETFPCQKAQSSGYGGLQFTLTYPAGTDFTLELQTVPAASGGCSSSNYTSEWFEISGLTGTQQVVTLDLGVYEASNLDAITGLVFASFSKVGAYTLSDLKFVCRNLEARAVQEPPDLKPSSAQAPATPSVQDVPGLFDRSRTASPVDGPSTFVSRVLSQSVSPVSPVSPVSIVPVSSPSRVSYAALTYPAAASSTAAAVPPDAHRLERLRRAGAGDNRSPAHPHTSKIPKTTITAIATTTRRPVISSTTYRPKPTSADACTDLLIDDWESQSRLTFLYYNSMYQPSSDDGTMKSIVVNNDNTVSIAPVSTDSYLYSQMPCVDTVGAYGGVSLRIKAARGTQFSVQLSSVDVCGSGNYTQQQTLSTADLGWTFDGSLRAYSFPLSKFGRVDPAKVSMIYFSSLTAPITLGPMAFYCGTRVSEIPAPAHPVNPQSQYSVPAPAETGSAHTSLLIDHFGSEDSNALGQWHGCDEDCVTSVIQANTVRLQTNDSDLAWYSSLADKCADITAFKDAYLHIPYSGSNKFSISLQQANADCNPDAAPYPETWDSLEASRYATDTDIYIPIAHFNVDLSRVTTFAFKGFYTLAPTTLKRIEIVPSVPADVTIPNKLPSGNLVFACKRPNSFAFAIDDGDPVLAQQVVEIVKSENINVTFFTVGLPLEDPSTNLSTVYLDMQARGHQIALHSFTHPKMEGLADYAAIDWEYNNDIAAVSKTFNGMHTPYFRPPFGTEGARMRQRLALALNVTDPYIVMWSVDVEDWLWGLSSTPEKQLDAFKRDLGNGGNLVVMHYLYPNTVKYLRQFIQLAKATGKQLMRVDQCMMDPRAPPL
ncbi:hypothetical protein SPBR_02305 [Sporothrix brasiliensis 5110]|uniref:NodB homology domain-containing protein n=1 Tax=Sporothrix brasiliensis 5110 TaxID=1398154 RepID=A0A0C2IZT1_9PEZI|nr:uncharacterized protein SPBR_02305 [Sporothrix brasiliensis 5110]KIH92250.1 hypothetical protein SPBR_02305 [Sporothrix brasiliensis 5110]